MSIINEALKKAQTNKKKQRLNKNSENDIQILQSPKPILKKSEVNKKLIAISVFVIFIAGLALSTLFFLRSNKKSIATSPSSPSSTFSSSRSSVMDSSTQPAAPGPGKITAEPSAIASFPQLILNGIVYDQEKPYAIVDNSILLKGDQIKGATLVEINKDSVKFSFQGREFELKAK